MGTNDLTKVFDTVVAKDYPLQALLNLEFDKSWTVCAYTKYL